MPVRLEGSDELRTYQPRCSGDEYPLRRWWFSHDQELAGISSFATLVLGGSRDAFQSDSGASVSLAMVSTTVPVVGVTGANNQTQVGTAANGEVAPQFRVRENKKPEVAMPASGCVKRVGEFGQGNSQRHEAGDVGASPRSRCSPRYYRPLRARHAWRAFPSLRRQMTFASPSAMCRKGCTPHSKGMASERSSSVMKN